MKKVRTLQRYQCDFCKRKSVKHIIALHEKRCFRNPKRFCDYCDNKRFTMETFDFPGATAKQVACPYCESFDKDQLKEIEKYESENKD